MSVIDSSQLLAAGDEGYQISRSVRLRSSASAYFSRTPSSASNQKTWTVSIWFKRSEIGSRTGLFSVGSTSTSPYVENVIQIDSADKLEVYNETNASGSWVYEYNFISTQVFRDPSAWYHLIVAVDTTQATSTNRVKIYLNGLQMTAFSTASYPTQNLDTYINTTKLHVLGTNWNSAALPAAEMMDGYLTEVNFIDGQALDPSYFGQTDLTTGVWGPKKYAGTYGTNGFYLNFSDNSNNTAATIGKDYSGNGNNWTPNNISVTAGSTYDSMLDVPTPYADGGNGRGNYCTLNPIQGTSTTFSNANLNYSIPASYGLGPTGTISASSGKWYWEVTPTSGNQLTGVGVASVEAVSNGKTYTTASSTYPIMAYEPVSGAVYVNGSSVTTTTTSAANDVIGIAYDAGANTAAIYKNGSLLYTATLTGTSGGAMPYLANPSGAQAAVGYVNFGQRSFAQTPPSGFKALNTQNLPDSTIKKGNQYFDATTYTGTGSSLSVANSGSMQPDLIWLKRRDGLSWHVLSDSVRGASKALWSNATDAETAYSSFVTSFNSNGFTLPSNVSGDPIYTNVSGQTYVGWQWKKGATQGFDIVTYTGNGTNGRTISHSLGVAPSMAIIKNRDNTYSWMVKHSSLASTYNVRLQDTGAATAAFGSGYVDGLTSSVFTLYTGASDIRNVNGNTEKYVAYLFAEVAGFSRFGSYTGNGSADGPFVYCGFRPRYILLKVSSTTGDWVIYDTSRDPYNAAGLYLYPDSSAAEAGSGTPRLDFLSNGFKLRQTGQDNTSSATYIFAAFAENPLKYSLAR